MNAHSPVIETTEVQKIENALDALLSAIVEYDRRPRPPRSDAEIAERYRVFSIGDLLAEYDAEQAMGGVQRKAHQFLKHPVAEALRQPVRLLGNRLYEIGGMSLMSEVCDRVANLDPSAWGKRTDIMDKRWDGIGRQGDSAGWCA